MPAYLIAEIDVADPQLYEEYRRRVPALIAEYGGRYLARGGALEVKEGDWTPKRLVLVEFASMEQARRFYESPAYAPLLALRRQATRSRLVLVEGA
ncbi:MAG: DUF1330 domain-containing protein [Betaproteobacteria bacterium]|nr:DUF1330 domain-containing protein [Betaproteobacteria bacterium]